MKKQSNKPDEDWIDDEIPEEDVSGTINDIITKRGKKRKSNRRKFNGYQNPGVDEID